MRQIIILTVLLSLANPAQASVQDKINTVKDKTVKVVQVTVATPFRLLGKLYGFVAGAFVEGVYEGVQALE